MFDIWQVLSYCFMCFGAGVVIASWVWSKTADRIMEEWKETLSLCDKQQQLNCNLVKRLEERNV